MSEAVIGLFTKYRNDENPVVIKLFCDVVRRSKLVKEIPVELKTEIVTSLAKWAELDQPKTRTSVQSALKFINS
mgnify:CR=1 FL=1